MTNRRLFAAMAVLLALPACAALQPSALDTAPGDLLSDAPPRPLGRACRVSGDPERLPSVGALVDSAAFAAAVADAWRGAGSPAGHVLLALRYDAQGVNVRRDVIEHRVGAALADTLQKLAFAHRRRLDPADREWSVRLRLDLGEAPRMRVGRTEVCSPRLRNGAEAGWTGAGGPSFGEARDPFALVSTGELPGASTVWVRVALDSRGNVTDARVERSLGRAMSEQRLLSYVRSIAFVPAMEDGWPVPGQLSMPLRMGR
jgi:TonB family protein